MEASWFSHSKKAGSQLTIQRQVTPKNYRADWLESGVPPETGTSKAKTFATVCSASIMLRPSSGERSGRTSTDRPGAFVLPDRGAPLRDWLSPTRCGDPRGYRPPRGGSPGSGTGCWNGKVLGSLVALLLLTLRAFAAAPGVPSDVHPVVALVLVRLPGEFQRDHKGRHLPGLEWDAL